MATILVVDDENLFRATIAKLLEKRGFQIVEADGAAAALNLIGEAGGSIDLALVDVLLPNTSGLALADRAKDLSPGLKVLFMSGYSLSTLEREHGMTGKFGTAFLQKPFETATLVSKIRELLERGQ